jgi:endogenous inhibitor of DNA gyrase (YacG/DUF329 family)
MVRKRSMKLHCPTCKVVVTARDPEFPFCSERCRTIDLGKWASGAYVIRSLIHDTSEDASSLEINDSSEDRR